MGGGYRHGCAGGGGAGVRKRSWDPRTSVAKLRRSICAPFRSVIRQPCVPTASYVARCTQTAPLDPAARGRTAAGRLCFIVDCPGNAGSRESAFASIGRAGGGSVLVFNSLGVGSSRVRTNTRLARRLCTAPRGGPNPPGHCWLAGGRTLVHGINGCPGAVEWCLREACCYRYRLLDVLLV
jgi:hypothetical protein